MIVTKGLVAVQIALAFVAFLVMLNGKLQGSLRGHIDVALSIILIGLLVTCWIFYGWKIALVSVVLCFIYARIASPIAQIIARKILRPPPFEVACAICGYTQDALPEDRICPKCGRPELYTAKEFPRGVAAAIHKYKHSLWG